MPQAFSACAVLHQPMYLPGAATACAPGHCCRWVALGLFVRNCHEYLQVQGKSSFSCMSYMHAAGLAIAYVSKLTLWGPIALHR